ncbi:MAG: hypothetical protein ACI4S4_00810 [Candidatus Ornithospirochaeta sp.]
MKYAVKEFSHLEVGFIAENCISDVRISEKAVHQDHPDGKKGGDQRVYAMNSESTSVLEGTVYYDLRLIARVPRDGEDIFLIVNLEVQNDDESSHSLVPRGIYYASRMISEQHGTVFTDMEYRKMQKVYSIWICPGKGKRRKGSIVRFNLKKEGDERNGFKDEKDYDKMEVVVIKVGKDCSCPENPLNGLLYTLFSPTMPPERKKEILSERYGILMTEELESEVKEMCNLSTAIREGALREGLSKGRREGRREGILATLFDLVDDGLLSVEIASAKANMSEKEFLKKKEELGK